MVEKAQEEVQRLKAQLQPKRARIETQEEEEDDMSSRTFMIGPLLNTEVRQHAYRAAATPQWALGTMRQLIVLELKATCGIRD